ncbi:MULTISPECIES: TonB-dependent receptor [Sphingobacterium]|uniref:TonB-dependent receptor n=1 Tax=Sphingobacterium populi TaxID=1812824 RepID=A0ABW5UEM5_9SPHI|nr:TonB-dependent receptor [Sphingobacterium sp. CFCC 11742]
MSIILFWVGLASQGHAQVRGKVITGTVIDSLQIGLKGVNVFLESDQDTLYTVTNGQGVYRFRGVVDPEIKLSYSMLGKERQTAYVSLYEHDPNPLVLSPVMLVSGISYIDPVQVLRAVPIVHKGDTTLFNLSGFSYEKQALLEDVLRSSLPGFNVLRDGTTFYNGQVITSVQVDGRKFFGGDVLTATRNLPADYIKQIEVIDHYGEMAEIKGIKNSKPEKIINIVLHEDRKKIMFGQATAGGGTNDRYLGSVGLNKFDRGQEVSIIASTNNTNTSLFTFGSPDGVGGRSASLSDIGDYADQADGLNTINSFGINFSDNIGQRSTLTSSYAYSQRKNQTLGNSLLRSTYDTYQITKTDDFTSVSDDRTHKFDFELNSRFKNNDLLKIKPSVILNRSVRDNKRNILLNNVRVRNDGWYQDSSTIDRPNYQLNALYSKHFQNPRRKLVGDVQVGYQRNDKIEDVSEQYVIYDTTSGIPMISRFNQQQLVNQYDATKSLRGAVSYVEPFFDHSLLEISYEYDLTNIEMSRRVRLPSEFYTPVVDSLGLNYEYFFSSNRTALLYQYEPNKRFRANLGFGVQPLRLSGAVANDTLQYRYDNINLIPSAMLRYRFNDELDWQFTYNGKNSQPNFLQIAPIRDNTNSRLVIVGNPLLRAEFVNRLSTIVRKSIPNKGQYLELNFAYNFTSNKIVASKTANFDETVQETSFINTDGYYELKGYYTFNSPLFNDQFHLETTGNLDYFNNIVFVNAERSLTRQYLFAQNLQLRYNWDEYFESVFNANYLLNQANFELPQQQRIAAHSALFSLGGRGYLSDRFMLGAEMSQRWFRGYVQDITDVSPTIINTYLEYSFWKNKMALLRLECFDLLDQNKNVGVVTEYVGNDIFESRNNRLGRYFMLTLNMRLQRLPK